MTITQNTVRTPSPFPPPPSTTRKTQKKSYGHTENMPDPEVNSVHFCKPKRGQAKWQRYMSQADDRKASAQEIHPLSSWGSMHYWRHVISLFLRCFVSLGIWRVCFRGISTWAWLLWAWGTVYLGLTKGKAAISPDHDGVSSCTAVP